MFWIFGGTENERKRDLYERLYSKLENLYEKMGEKIRVTSNNVDNYSSSMISLDSFSIPEDEFESSQKSVRNQVMVIEQNQISDFNKIPNAIFSARQRYEYYSRLVEEERRQREEEERSRREEFENSVRKFFG
ncbi:MAG: hypothetical protein SPI53_02355 [Erysipelotrichaceae bacterium]|nr:hypothetical protein [Erysipelotrichaceae bacterium]